MDAFSWVRQIKGRFLFMGNRLLGVNYSLSVQNSRNVGGTIILVTFIGEMILPYMTYE